MKAPVLLVAVLLSNLLPSAWSHPHEPHPLGAPTNAITTVKATTALPEDTKLAVVDGAHHPEQATQILQALARKPNLRELKIYGATKWKETALAPLKDFKRLEVLRIFDDTTRRKPGFFHDIAKAKQLKTLQLYYSGD